MDQWIPALRDGDDLPHSDVEGVSGVLSDFYFSLFSANIVRMPLAMLCGPTFLFLCPLSRLCSPAGHG